MQLAGIEYNFSRDRQGSAYLLHSVIESSPVGVCEEPGRRRLDVVDHLVDRHEREPNAVDELTGKVLSIGSIEVDPPNYGLHATPVACLGFQ